MKTLENTTIDELTVKELFNRNMLAQKEFVKFVPEILFKGVAAYLNSLEVKSVLAHISAPVYGESRNTFMNVYFYHNNNEHKLKFYTVRTLKDQDMEDGFNKDLDKTIYLHDDKDGIKFIGHTSLHLPHLIHEVTSSLVFSNIKIQFTSGVIIKLSLAIL